MREELDHWMHNMNNSWLWTNWSVSHKHQISITLNIIYYKEIQNEAQFKCMIGCPTTPLSAIQCNIQMNLIALTILNIKIETVILIFKSDLIYIFSISVSTSFFLFSKRLTIMMNHRMINESSQMPILFYKRSFM